MKYVSFVKFFSFAVLVLRTHNGLWLNHLELLHLELLKTQGLVYSVDGMPKTMVGDESAFI